jgi:hypothetical protein
MADLAATNKALTKQLADKDIIRLRGAHNTNHPKNTPDCNRNRNRGQQTQRRYSNENYCWSHGFDIHNSHTSLTCCWPEDGHKASRPNWPPNSAPFLTYGFGPILSLMHHLANPWHVSLGTIVMAPSSAMDTPLPPMLGLWHPYINMECHS